MTQKPDRIATFAAAAGLALAAGAASGQFAGFSEPVFIETTQYPWSLAAADLNGDGHDDLAVMDFVGDVGVLLSNGDGTFADVQILETGATRARSNPRVADVDGDGNADIIAATNVGVAIFYGNGDGTFDASVFVNAEKTDAVAVGDLDGDGLLDAVLAIQPDPDDLASEIVISLNDGGRMFVGQTSITRMSSPPWDVALADIDGDGTLDLVAGDPSGNRLLVFRGNGDGSFGGPDELSTSANPVTVAVGDLNGDGHPDIANTNGTGCRTVDIFFNNGDGTFGSPARYEADSANGLLVIGDVNNDGLADLLASGPGQSGVVVAIGNGDGTFRAGQAFAAGGVSVRGTLGDFDGDGDLDFAAANALEGCVSVLTNETARTAEPCPADFDGSGTADVNDLLGFLGAFRVQGAGSDFDGNGSVDVNDLLGFLGAFRGGCPA